MAANLKGDFKCGNYKKKLKRNKKSVDLMCLTRER